MKPKIMSSVVQEEGGDILGSQKPPNRGPNLSHTLWLSFPSTTAGIWNVTHFATSAM